MTIVIQYWIMGDLYHEVKFEVQPSRHLYRSWRTYCEAHEKLLNKLCRLYDPAEGVTTPVIYLSSVMNSRIEKIQLESRESTPDERPV